jgi:hypothetical protein
MARLFASAPCIGWNLPVSITAAGFMKYQIIHYGYLIEPPHTPNPKSFNEQVVIIISVWTWCVVCRRPGAGRFKKFNAVSN